MKISKVIVASTLLAASATLLALADGEIVPESKVRGHFKLPKLFDFERFKELFTKSYGSLSEELARRKLYLATAFRVFISAVSYKHRGRNSYLAINQMSDWSRKEKDQLYARPAGFDEASEFFRSTTGDDHDDDDDDEDEDHDEYSEYNFNGPPVSLPPIESSLPTVLDMEEIEAVLSEVEAKRSEPGFHELAEELSREQMEQRTRRRRDTGEPRERRVSFEELSGFSIDSDPDDKSDTPTGGQGHSLNGLDLVQEVRPDVAPLAKSSSVHQAVASPLKSALKYVSNMFSSRAQPTENLPDEISIDHRESGCLTVPKNQGRCGSCYAFAPISIYEWHLCKTTNIRANLSEQYLVNCAPNVLKTFFSGCTGGWPDLTPRVIKSYGLELRSKYPYRARKYQCPYSYREAAKATNVSLRVQDEGFKRIWISRTEKRLVSEPLLINVYTNLEFEDYGGGVDDFVNCKMKYGHAMVLVGSGREDGKDYWLLRNSFGVSWGELGYMKMNKRSVGCIEFHQTFRLKNFKFISNTTELI